MSASPNREFNDPERYEREQATRIMPDDFRQWGIYLLRMKTPPKVKTFAVEYPICVVDIRAVEQGHEVGFALYTKMDSSEIKLADSYFNRLGFMALHNTGEARRPDLSEEDEIEIGYVVGSTDEIDIEFAELVQQSHDLAPTH